MLEVLLALALVAMLVGGIVSFLSQLSDGKAALSRLAGELQSAGAVIERMEQDLMGTVAGAPGLGAGVKGTGTQVRLVTRGVWLEIGSAPEREDGTAGTVRGAMAAGDVQVSEYSFDESGGRLMARRWNAGTKEEPPAMEVVSERVGRVRLRYHDGREWLETFDSAEAGALPVAVEVGIWFGKRDAGAAEDGKGAEVKWGAPDRLRVIVVPDGPVAASRERP